MDTAACLCVRARACVCVGNVASQVHPLYVSQKTLLNVSQRTLLNVSQRTLLFVSQRTLLFVSQRTRGVAHTWHFGKPQNCHASSYKYERAAHLHTNYTSAHLPIESARVVHITVASTLYECGGCET